MSMNSIVLQTLNLIDHKIVDITYSTEEISILFDKKLLHRLPCSHCGTRCRIRDRLDERRWQHISIWGIRVTLIYRPYRILCKTCGIVVEDIPWTMGKSPLTKPFILQLATFGKVLPWQEVAEHFNVSWGTVYNAVYNAVEYGLDRRDLSHVRLIGIDELSRKKRHTYHTNVYDLESRILLWSGEGRSTETLKRFFDEMGPDFARNLVGICCDMWDPYISVIQERAPQAEFVFDKFHLIRHLLNAIDKVRKEEARKASEAGSDVLTGTKYLLLRNPCNLTDDQRRRLEEVQKLNGKISKAYILKEAFRQLWSYKDPNAARGYLMVWLWWATHSRIKPLREFAGLVKRHMDNILSWFHLPIDNGITEAMNNNAKVISHRARGFRSEHVFTLAMMHCLGGLQMPETTHKFL